MPKVCINKQQYKEDSIGSWIVSMLYKKKLTRKALSKELCMTPHGLNWKLRNNSFDYSDLLTIFEFLGATDEEVLFVMKL